MKIHEYQAKELLGEAGIPVPKSVLVSTAEEAMQAALDLKGRVVIKAQVHAGGRGKAGGIKPANGPEEAFEAATNILGLNLKGHIVKKVLVTEAIDIRKEFYAGITIDRSAKKAVLMVSVFGGIDIEEVASKTPEQIKKVYIEPSLGLNDFQARQLGLELVSDIKSVKQLAFIFKKLYKVFEEKDCSLIEINPLAVTDSGAILAVDSKINFDDNALERHPELESLRDLGEEDSDELEAKKFGLSFVKLEGNIGCIVNGAGLAMATMDTIKLFGGEPANFLDVGGSSSPEKIIRAFELILKNKNIKVVLINIFGGITRCDDIAQGLLQARQRLEITAPIVIRLIGTNQEEAGRILSSSKLLPYSDMKEAIKKAVDISKEGD